jgi:hypothetical protein
VEQELLTLLGHQSSPQVLVGFVMMDNTSGAVTANPPGAPEFTSGFSGGCDDGPLKPEVNSGAPGGLAVPAQLVLPIVTNPTKT